MLDYKTTKPMIKSDFITHSAVRTYFRNMAFKSKYRSRNVANALVILKTLEVEYHTIEQFIFIERTDELMDKLGRLGYAPLPATTDELTTKQICTIMYNEEYNVAFHLYDGSYATAIKLAVDISTKAKSNDKLQIFLSGVNVLTANTKNKKQILLG